MTRLNLISVRQQAASLVVAAVMTLAVLASLGNVANGYHAELAQAEAGITEQVVVQQVVVTAKRHANT